MIDKTVPADRQNSTQLSTGQDQTGFSRWLMEEGMLFFYMKI